MGLHKKFKAYFTECVDRTESLAKIPVRKFKAADFHRLRVEIKKIKACVKLMEHCSHQFTKEDLLKPYKRLFTRAGKVRELQVEESVIKRSPSSNGVRNYLFGLKARELKMKRKYFLGLEKEKSPEMLRIKNKCLPYIPGLKQKNIREYMNKLEARASRLLKRKKIKDKVIHELRKKLKTIYYIGKSTGIVQNKQLQRKTEIIQELMGEWHDYETICKHFGNDLKRDKWEKNEKIELRELHKDLLKKKQSLFKEVKNSLAKIKE